ncbi:MAG: GNAT family N-acetyltransferase [Theionarchaea archaeon]|nr:GNAT family N-acetyltransferase [Theionarchaea archaeon]
MTYIIKSYQEEFLDAQEQVGREVTKNWTPFIQTPAEQLKQIYSQPDFDPETRHYCFKNSKLVGFLTSSVLEEAEKVKKANLEFPLVLPGHEEAEQLLFEKALKILRKKGANVIRTRVSESWGKTVEMAERWGYTFAEKLAECYRIHINAADIKEIPDTDITAYHHQRDLEQMVTIFVTEYDMTPEQAHFNFESLEKAGDKVVAHLVMRKDGEIAGRALALRDDYNPHQAYTGALYVTQEEQRKLFLTKILLICKEKGIKMLDTTIFGNLLSMKDQLAALYTSLGFDHIATVSYYEKEIPDLLRKEL